MVRRVYAQDLVYVKTVQQRLQGILVWAMANKHRKNVVNLAVRKARNLLERQSDRLVSHSFRTRVKKGDGKHARNLTSTEKTFSDEIIDEYLKGFRAIVQDALNL